MKKTALQRKIIRAMNRANEEAKKGDRSFYGRGLSREGYSGGYQQALNDVLLVSTGVPPTSSRCFMLWKEEQE